MKIVFLDIDGVLNSVPFMEALQARLKAEGKPLLTRYMIDPVPVARLNTLLKETGAKVVVSSSWRKLFDTEGLQRVLDAQGFEGEIIDVTPDLSYDPAGERERGHEIEKWVEDHSPDATFVIFDDDSDMGNLHHRFVQTQWGYGLLDENINRARELLTT
jgi:hypothetical protein